MARLLQLFCLTILSFAVNAQSYYNNKGAIVLKVSAEKSSFNKGQTVLVRAKDDQQSKSWLKLKKASDDSLRYLKNPADAVFDVTLPKAGLYYLRTAARAEKPRAAGTTSYVWIKIDDQRPTRRILYDSYAGAMQVAGKFEFTGKPQHISVWLPSEVSLGYIELKEFIAPDVPLAVQNYQPPVAVPQARPRLWVNQSVLPVIKARLQVGENKPAWEKVKEIALKPANFGFDMQKEIFHREDVEKIAETKAFYYLMTSDTTVGKQAVKVMGDYLSVLEFGNVTYGDITREVGRAIYTAALVYDWCYDLLDQNQKRVFYTHMKKLAIEMEIGWPPFDESLLNGHGNEAQLSRDLLAMSIAVYDEDPLPYKYTSYRILEQLVPMRKFEYQSPRHNQGVDYGAYRFGWEMYGVWLMYRMSGMESFDDNIKQLPNYWLHMRLPDGYMLRDGDMFSVKNKGSKPLYWKQPQTMLLSSAYANNGLFKAELEREGGLPDNPVLFLLVNDPALKADHDLTKLPQTKTFGQVLGSMITRTGWDNTPGSDDVIAEIKGGGYNFGNHQHADAGGLQIFYHGMQLGDIGLYLSYGSAYDLEFNKRSVSHSTMLVVDPKEPLLFRTKVHDGGSRFSQRFPLSADETLRDPWYNYGSVISQDFGPDAQKPSFSYFKADLTAAYTKKLSAFSREFTFLDLKRKDVPAVIILSDDVQSSDKDFKKYWQVNTVNKPDTLDGMIQLTSELAGKKGTTLINMLVPSAEKRELNVLSGKAANTVFEKQFEINSDKPEANAHRIMISPKNSNENDRFLTVFQMLAEGAEPLAVKFSQPLDRYELIVADRFVSLSSSKDFVSEAFDIQIPSGSQYQALLAGLKPGFWNVKGPDGKVVNYNVEAGKNTVFFAAQAGSYSIAPFRSSAPPEVSPPPRP